MKARREESMQEDKQAGALRTACVVIPTYNESGNIVALLDRIFENDRRHAASTGVALRALVVDDSSPDGTAALVEQYRAGNPRVSILVRKQKEGLGAAYIAGMRHALSLLRPDIIIEMDADFSHNPDDLYRLIAQIQRGSDFVIGSRYVEGGSIPAQWSVRRRLLSKAANAYTRLMLNMSGVQDCSGGFRAMRASALRRIDLERLQVKGYVFQVSLLNAIMRTGGSVQEVPIAFSERAAGKSKMGLADMIEGGVAVLRLRLSRQSYALAPMLETETPEAADAKSDVRLATDDPSRVGTGMET